MKRIVVLVLMVLFSNEIFSFKKEDFKKLEKELKKTTGVKECKGCDLSGRFFDNRNFSDIDFAGANFANALFAKSLQKEQMIFSDKTNKTNFEGAFFQGATFTDQNLSKVNFKNVDFSGAKFERSDLSGANFENANFTGAKLENVNVSNLTNFKNAIFEDAFVDDKTQKLLLNLKLLSEEQSKDIADAFLVQYQLKNFIESGKKREDSLLENKSCPFCDFEGK